MVDSQETRPRLPIGRAGGKALVAAGTDAPFSAATGRWEAFESDVGGEEAPRARHAVQLVLTALIEGDA